MTQSGNEGPNPQRLVADNLEIGIARLSQRLKEVEAFRISPLDGLARLNPAQTLGRLIERDLAKAFGRDTGEFEQYQRAAHFGAGRSAACNLDSEAARFLEGERESSLMLLRSAVEDLRRKGEEVEANSNQISVKPPATGTQSHSSTLDIENRPLLRPKEEGGFPPGTYKVFVVHGRDDSAKDKLTLFLTRAGCTPVVLHEQANQGRTIIEKFEEFAGQSTFAIVILSPDDEARLKGEQTELEPRARQNVIAELGWFAGRLGRNRVCALVKGKVELPSDFAGVGYVDMDPKGSWKREVAQELEAASFSINWSDAMK